MKDRQNGLSSSLATWQTRPLSACLQKVRIPRKVPKASFKESGPIPIISQEADFINGYWDNDGDAIKVDEPLVVYGDHTQVLKLIDFDFVVGADGVKVLKPKEFVEAAFLYYFLEAHPVRSLGYARHFRHISGMVVPLPSLEEQRRIVAVLDEAFSTLDRASANVEANLMDACTIFQSWLAAAFRDGSAEWAVKYLPDISENLDRSRVPITKSDREPGDVPYYGASGVVDHVADSIFDEDLLLISEDGANLLARTYPIAFAISGRSWVNNHAHVLRFDDIVSQEFVRLYLNSIPLAPWVSGMAQPKLNQKALNSIPIPYPDATERKRIVSEAAEIWANAEAARANYETQVKEVSSLRQAILQKAFKGELTA